MAKKINESLVKTGMDRDSHPSNIQNNTTYTHAKNANIENENGEFLILKNEKSNILASKFKEGFKAIHAVNDIDTTNTYFFLVNPATGVGEFGIIENNQSVPNLEDTLVACGDCSYYNELSEPLEELEQVALQTYTTLLSDACTTPENGFNFNILNPIKTSIIKNEKTGKTIYFSHKGNPPRYINIGNILKSLENNLPNYLLVKEEPCTDDTILTCPDFDKMRVFKLFSIPKLTPASTELGGNLKMGVYEFLVAYCNSDGQEISEYYSISTPVSIFDENNQIQGQPETSSRTNLSIRLNIENLDSKYTHYKIAVIQTADIENATRYFEEGVHTINDTSILYSTEQNKKETSIDALTRSYLFVEEAEGVATANNVLYQCGVTNKKELNLQPVINLLGEIGVKWQTHIASEDIYKNGVIASKFTGYNREEVVPIGIKFGLKGGYETATFPLINRIATLSDLEEVPLSNKDRDSVESNLNCVQGVRDERWKIYDTASVDEDFCEGDIGTKEVVETITRYCVVEKVAEIPAGQATIFLDTDYTDLADYINGTQGESEAECDTAYETSTVDICAYLYADYSDVVCPPLKIDLQLLTQTPLTGLIVVNIGGDLYDIIFNVDLETTISDFVTANAATILANTGATITAGLTSINFYGTIPTVTIISTTGDVLASITQLFEDNCTDATIVDSSILVASIEGETKTDIESIFPTEYVRMSIPKIGCNLYKTATSDLSELFDLDYDQDPDPPLGWGCGTFSIIPFVSYLRDSDFVNQDCGYAKDIVFNQDVANNTSDPFFLNYAYSENILDLVLPPTSGATTDGGFIYPGNLTKTAQWFKGTTDNKNRFIVDLSRQKNLPLIDTVGISPSVRMTLFSKCSDLVHLYSDIIPADVGGIYLFEKVGTSDLKITNGAGTVTTIVGGWFASKKYLIAVDAPLGVHNTIFALAGGLDDCANLVAANPRWVVHPIPGCMTISKRDIEYSKALITWTSIRIDKELQYEASCIFNQPIIQACTAVPYKKGTFAFWQSDEKYPDNNELYNSSTLEINQSDIPIQAQVKFEQAFVSSINEGEYTWREDDDDKPLIDFTCRGIRHFKFPSNLVAPYIWDSKLKAFSSTPIFPLGLTVDEEVINAMLDLALKNNLITQIDRDNIVSYEIVRGDLTLDRSIITSGLLFDTRTYTEGRDEYLYSNYPYNSYSNDKLNNLPKTPNFGISNSNFTFHSPETDYGRPTIPSELSVQGYVFGNSKGHFDEVKGHPEYTVITEKARNLASQLALLEVVAEATIAAMQALSNAQVWGVAGTASTGVSTGAPAYLASATIAVFGGITSAAFKYGRYRYEWLKIFRDLGSPKNFAYYYYSTGDYNYMNLLQEEQNMLRGVNIGKYLKEGLAEYTNEVTAQALKINNTLRERSVFLSTGNFPIRYNTIYSNYDNNSYTSSLTNAGECGVKNVGKSTEVKRNVASPYVFLKNYKPSQHGAINSVRWLTTGYRGDLMNPRTDCDCLPIFGGDTFISRHTVKRKHSQFLVNALGQSNNTPFNYYYYNNIGRNPKYYLSYGVNKDFEGGGKLFPDLVDDFVFDNETKDGNYYIPPSKFYLYYYGVPSFLCETRINTNYRYAETPLQRQFFPQVGDLGNWTQEKNVSIREPEYFFYNKAYSKQVTRFKNRTLADNYNKELNDVRTDFPNGILSSLPDNSENNTYDPWLIYRPLDFFEFPTNFGKLKHVQGIENEAIFVRFENTSILYNKVDYTNDDGQSPTRPFLGGTSAFQRRSSSFYNAQLGFGGSQNTTSVSCEFGHFHVDAKRGQVIQTQPSGQQMEEISAMIGGKPSGMRAWFKEHLPFKILKYFKDVDVDNNYNGVGITMAWDSRYRRVFITKKDYIPTNPAITHLDGKYFLGETEVFLTDNTKFLDVSWTIAFSPILGAWMSFYDFKPNYYVSHNEYFQSGVNNTGSKFGLWSHGLTNKSFGVFYGDKYSFDVEYMVKNEYATKRLDSVSLFTEAKRYHNEYDWSFNPDLTFNKSLIHNNVACSGYLNLIPQRNNFFNNKNYPKTNADGTQDILISNKDNFQWNYNYFYNRVQNNNSNIPFINYDKNQIEKSINSNIVGFKGKRVLDRINGDYFLNRLSYNTDSRFSLGLKFTLNEVDI